MWITATVSRPSHAIHTWIVSAGSALAKDESTSSEGQSRDQSGRQSSSERVQCDKFRDETSASAPWSLGGCLSPQGCFFGSWRFFLPGLSWCPFCIAMVWRCLCSVAVGVCCAAVSAWLSLCALLPSCVCVSGSLRWLLSCGFSAVFGNRFFRDSRKTHFHAGF